MSNIIRTVSNKMFSTIELLFHNFLQQGIFPDQLIACVSRFSKNGDKSLLANYSPFLVLPYFSKCLKCIIYNRLYGFVIRNEIHYNKQLDSRLLTLQSPVNSFENFIYSRHFSKLLKIFWHGGTYYRVAET